MPRSATHLVRKGRKNTVCGMPIVPGTSWILEEVEHLENNICTLCLAFKRKREKADA